MNSKNVWAFQLAVVCALTAGACSKKPPAAPAAPPSVAPEPPPAPPPAPPRPNPEPRGSTEEEWFRSATTEELQARLASVYFDYDRDELKPEARSELQKSAEWLLKPYNTLVIEVEGHCDERGTLEYNLALGERRSNTAAGYLATLGVPKERLRTVSYGKERPQCTTPAENCWWKNRRAHLRIFARDSRTSEE